MANLNLLRISLCPVQFRQFFDKANPRNILIKRLPKPKVPDILTTTGTEYLRRSYKHNPDWEKDDQFAAALAHPDYFGVMNRFTVRDMMQARIHFGHKIGRQSPAMNDLIFGERLGVSIFDLDKTKPYFDLALNFLAHIAYRGGIILFVTNDKSTKHLVEKAAKDCHEYSHCHLYTKHTFLNSLHWFGHLIRLPDVVVFTNCMTRFRLHRLVKESAKLAIPTISVIDSDFEFPQAITYPIPGNDDSIDSIKFYLNHIKYAILAGKKKRYEEFGPDNDDLESSKKLFAEIMQRKQKEAEESIDIGEQSIIETTTDNVIEVAKEAKKESVYEDDDDLANFTEEDYADDHWINNDPNDFNDKGSS